MTDEEMLKVVKRLLKQEIGTLIENIDRIAKGIVELANSQLNCDAHSDRDRDVMTVLVECFFDGLIANYEDEKEVLLRE